MRVKGECVAEGLNRGIALIGCCKSAAELDGILHIGFGKIIGEGELEYGVGVIILIQIDRTEMEVRGCERGIQCNCPLKFRSGLVISLLLGEDGAESVMQCRIVGCADKGLSELLLRRLRLSGRR